MTTEEGGWTVYGERTAYDSPWVRLQLADVRSPAGERFEYHVVELSPIALALVVDEQDRVLMLWKYRFPTDQWGYELPGGLVEDGEDPADAAARETLEETGWTVSGEPEHLLELEPLPGQVRARTNVFLWRAASRSGGPTDPEESTTRSEWPSIAHAGAMVRDGRLLGSTTAIALLYYLQNA